MSINTTAIYKNKTIMIHRSRSTDFEFARIKIFVRGDFRVPINVAT